MRRGPRYLAVVAFGFGVDLGLALVLNRVVGLDLTLAAAVGFLVALLANYLLFETWAFRRRETRLSGRRLLATMVSAGVALGVRLAAVATLSRLVGEPRGATAAAILIAAAGLSLLVNWSLVSRIFARDAEPS